MGVHVGVFRKPTIKRHNPRTLRKNVGEDYHGCLAVSVLRSSELYQKIAGWAEGAMRATLRPGRASCNLVTNKELPGEDLNLC